MNRKPSDEALQTAALFSGSSEMAARMQAFDWSSTAAGPVAQWPDSLRTAVRIVLNSRFPMFIWWGADAATYLYNDAYIPVLGTRHPAALGRSGAEVWPEIWDTLGAFARDVLAHGRASWSEELPLMMERNGYREETFFTFSYSPILERDGSIGGLFCACTEDTRRVIAERRLRTQRELAGEVASALSIDEACDKAALYLASNPRDLPFTLLYLLDDAGTTARLVAASGLSLAAAPVALRRAALDAPQHDPWQLGAVARSGAGRLHTDLSAAFGAAVPTGAWEEPPHAALVMPLARPGHTTLAGFAIFGLSPRRPFDEDYEEFCALLARHIATGISNARAYDEERRRAAALAELDRAKTVFFSDVSHELRTPLTLMLGPLADLLADEARPAAEREQLAIARRNGLRLLKLVNTLLDFSRIEAGRVDATYEPTDLSALTADLASSFRSAFERAGLSLTVDCPPLDTPVHVDREMWEKIVLNLLSNALKFTLAGGVEVRVERRGADAACVVRDTGLGIPAEELPHVFERFRRVRNAAARTHEGTGIGLALVAELVRLHGGTIALDSRVGEGTTATVTIPTGTAHLPAERLGGGRPPVATASRATPFVEEALRWLHDDDAPPATAPQPGSDAGRVLIADDNQDMRDYLRRLLRPYWQVDVVANGAEALRRAEEAPPDLVLSDVMMPHLDGFGLLRALRERPATRAVPVLLLSARAGEEARLEGLQAGADDYLVKPFSARELVARITILLELSRARRAAGDSVRRHTARQALLLALSRDLLAAGSNEVAIAARVFEGVAAPLGVDVMLNYRRTADGGLELVTGHGIPPELREPVRRLDPGQAYCGKVTATGTALCADARDIATNPRGEFVRRLGLRAYACQPLLASDGRPLGTLSFGSRQREQFDEEDTEFFQTVSHLVAIAWERGAAERSLRASEDRFRSMVQALPNIIFEADANGTTTFLSDRFETYTGLTPADAGADGWLAAVHPDQRTEVAAHWRTAVREQSLFEARVRLRDAGGGDTHRWFFCRALPARDDGGLIARWSGSLVDVEELIRTQEALRDADRRKDEFLAMLAHELRNPLAPIRNAAQVLRHAEPTGSRLAAARDIIERQVVQMTRLVDDLLDVSRITRGTIALRRDELLLNELVSRAVETAQPLIATHRHTLSLDLPARPIAVRGDETRLIQVIANLLGNAAKFTPAGGRIQVGVAAVEGHAEIRVRDTGIGIEPTARVRIFDLFRQEDDSLARSQGGLGIGLTLVKRLVELHGGTVSVYSAGRGQGAEFLVRLPMLAQPRTAPSPAPAANGGPPRMRTLIVEDNPDTADSFALLLELDGHEVHVARDGFAAVEAAERHRPDVAFIDLGLPGLDGFEVARRLRRRGGTAPLLVAVSGYGRPEDRAESSAAGFDHHLIKPVQYEVVRTLLERHAPARRGA